MLSVRLPLGRKTQALECSGFSLLNRGLASEIALEFFPIKRIGGGGWKGGREGGKKSILKADLVLPWKQVVL